MDTPVVDNRLIKPRHLRILIPSVLLLALVLYLLLRDSSSTYRAEREKCTIEATFLGPFHDFIRLTGVVEPISSVSVEALEGGRVEEVLLEEGSMVEKGDVIVKLRNEALNLSFTDQHSSYAYLTNELTNQLIQVKQQEISDKQELLAMDNDINDKGRKLQKVESLYAKGGVSPEEYLVLKGAYETAVKNRELKLQKMSLDSALRRNQRSQIEMKMLLVRQQLDNLNVRAPLSGLLGSIELEVGQSVGKGQRIGQISDLSSYKITAQVDEHYIDRIRKGLVATVARQQDTFLLELAKVYPEVKSNQFRIDLRFVAGLPSSIRTGQSYSLSLQLGETREAIQIAKGGFFQSTGGQWVYVLLPDGRTAVKRNIKIGRQNPQYYEIIEGLEPGEQVITSNYDAFGDNDKIIFN